MEDRGSWVYQLPLSHPVHTLAESFCRDCFFLLILKYKQVTKADIEESSHLTEKLKQQKNRTQRKQGTCKRVETAERQPQMRIRINKLEKKWQPIPDSFRENPMARGTWRATVYGVAESDTTEWAQINWNTMKKEHQREKNTLEVR